ncbi:IS3 family transposase [Tessaracoccus sp. HDW20]|nr:IS3 family transposase [Tessaracoccus coleopterorum]
MQRCFRADRPNELWVVDFTYVPTWSGMAFTAFVTDVFSRRIVGWRTMDRMPTDLPLDALEMALWVRDRAGQDVAGVIQHSDAGAQYTAIRYAERLADVGAIASIGTVGDSYDNALAESVVGLYKTECVKIDGPFRTADELELATLSWVHWFNENRLHSSIGYLTPIEKENEYYRENNPSTSRRWENSPSTKPGRFSPQPHTRQFRRGAGSNRRDRGLGRRRRRQRQHRPDPSTSRHHPPPRVRARRVAGSRHRPSAAALGVALSPRPDPGTRRSGRSPRPHHPHPRRPDHHPAANAFAPEAGRSRPTTTHSGPRYRPRARRLWRTWSA